MRALDTFLRRQPRPVIAVMGAVLLGLAAWADYALSLRGIALPLYYLVPIGLTAWAAGWPLAGVITVLAAALNAGIDWQLRAELNNPLLVQIVSLLFFGLVLWLVRVGSTLRLMAQFYLNSRQWRGQLPPTPVGAGLTVVGADSEAARAGVPDVDGQPGPDYIPLVLEPGRAFGTGSHPTTRLCVGLIEKYLQPGDRVFDLGCGTGILSLAAARLGAGSVFGADIDPEAIRSAKANARLNQLEDKLTFALGPFDEVLMPNAPTPNLQSPFDLTLANILTDILVEQLKLGLAHTVRSGGHLILSGIKTEERPRLLAALAAELMEVVEEREAEGWVALAARWQSG